MPFEIRRQGGKYCVYTQGTDHNHGCHVGKAEAKAQMRALYANVKEAKMSEPLRFAIFTDMWSYKLSDDVDVQQWLMYAPRGTYSHPVYGSLEFNDRRFKQWEENWRNNVLGTDIAIDRDHAPDGNTEALAWVKDVQIRPDGFWILVEWTPGGYKLVHKDKAFRYFSPEFGMFKNPQTEVIYDEVMLGGAATNRPFIKNMMPMAASENWWTGRAGTEDQSLRGEGGQESHQSISLGGEMPNESGAAATNPQPPVETPEPPKEDNKGKRLTELESQHKLLAERNAQLEAQVETQNKRLRLAEVDSTLAKWRNFSVTLKTLDATGAEHDAGTVTRCITPKFAEMYREFKLKEKDYTIEQFVEASLDGWVELGERGTPFDTGEAPDESLNERIRLDGGASEMEVVGLTEVKAARDYALEHKLDWSDPDAKLQAFQAVRTGAAEGRTPRSY